MRFLRRTADDVTDLGTRQAQRRKVRCLLKQHGARLVAACAFENAGDDLLQQGRAVAVGRLHNGHKGQEGSDILAQSPVSRLREDVAHRYAVAQRLAGLAPP